MLMHRKCEVLSGEMNSLITEELMFIYLLISYLVGPIT